MPVRIFLSTVSDEFREYRDQLHVDLTRHNVEVKVQEHFKDLGTVTLTKLDTYIQSCDAVVHLVGNMTGAVAKPASTKAVLAKYLDIRHRLPPLWDALEEGGVSYTQWEAWLALYHGKLLLIAEADQAAPRGPSYAPTEESCAAQRRHLARLRTLERYPGCTFKNSDHLAKEIAFTAILDLFAKDRANSHLAGLVESLVDLATMVFVDVMRLACVAGSDIARVANQSRYQEFVDIADRHLREWDTRVMLVKEQLALDAVSQCLSVNERLGWALSRLRLRAKLDGSWPEFVNFLAQFAAQVDQLARSLSRDYYVNKSKEITGIVTPTFEKMPLITARHAPNEFVRCRFLAQSIVLNHMNEGNEPKILTIRDDFDRRLAVPYFTIDAMLLRA